jgi:hypothetical protein
MKNKNIIEFYTGIHEFQKGYEPRAKLVKDEKGDLYLRKIPQYFQQLLKVCGANNVRQAKIHGVEPLVTEPSLFEIEII